MAKTSWQEVKRSLIKYEDKKQINRLESLIKFVKLLHSKSFKLARFSFFQFFQKKSCFLYKKTHTSQDTVSNTIW